MKTITLILAASMLLSFTKDDKFTEAMTKNIQLVYKADTPESLIQAVNSFERIGAAERTRWEPYYYESFGYIMLADQEKKSERKDAFLDLAKEALKKAEELNSNDSEIIALDGFINMIRITVDTPTRGPRYSMIALQLFSRAIELNPENPRALALLAQLQLGTSKFFNSPPTEACETNQRALGKFNDFKPESLLAPAWGKGMAEELTKVCQ